MKLVEGKLRNEDTTDKVDDAAWPAVDVTGTEGTLTAKQTGIFRTSIELTAADLKMPKALTLGRVDEDGTVYINGEKIGESHEWDRAQRFEIAKALHPGKNLIAVVVVNKDGAGGLAQHARLESEGPAIPAQWELSDQTAGISGKWFDETLDDSSWQTVKLDNSAASEENTPLLTWYRVKFELPAPKATQWVPWKINLSAVGNGFLYLNGHPLGRWWQQGPQRDFYLPECWLHFGPGKTNVLTISLRPTEGAKLKSAEVLPYANLAELKS